MIGVILVGLTCVLGFVSLASLCALLLLHVYALIRGRSVFGVDTIRNVVYMTFGRNRGGGDHNNWT